MEAEEGDMADGETKKLRQRRSLVAESLPALSRTRDDTYRLNSDALALDRAGVTQHAPEELTRLRERQLLADAAIRDAQCEIRDLDAEIKRASGDGLGAKFAGAVRRGRGSSR
jgi:hypothetical protein